MAVDISQLSDEEKAQLRERANQSLKQSGLWDEESNLPRMGNRDPYDLLEREMGRIAGEDKLKKDKAKQEADAKKEQLERLGLSKIDPDLREHAYKLFPDLQKIAPQQQIPFAPGESEEPVIEEQQSSTEQKASPKVQRAPAVEKSEVSSEPVKQQPQSVSAPEEDEVSKLMKQSEENERQAKLDMAVAKFRDAVIGAGGTGYKSDLSSYEENIKGAKKPIENMLLKNQLQDEQAKRDPNSTISKLLRRSLEEMGMSMAGLEKIPYAQLEKLYPSLTNALNTKIAAEARKEENALKRSERSERMSMADYHKAQSGIDRQVQQLNKSDALSSYTAAKQATTLLDEALRSKDPQVKIQRAAAFMNYAKSAQGDKSVVRSEDMKVLAGSMGISPEAMFDKILAKSEGSEFTNAELEMMKKVSDTIANVKRKQVQQLLTPIIKRAESNQVDLSESIDPYFVKDIMQSTQESIPEGEIKDLTIDGQSVKYRKTSKGWERVK